MVDNNLESEHLKLEQYKARLDYDRFNLEKYKVDVTVQQLLFKSVLKFSTLAIKALLITNGIAAVIIFAFLGYTHETPNQLLVKAVHSFGLGLIAAILTVAIAYLTQVFFSEARTEQTKKILGNFFRFFAIASALFSLLKFSIGLNLTVNSFSNGTDTNCSEPHHSAIDYLNALGPYAWPIVSFIVFIIVLFLFHRQIGEKIKDLKQVGKDGASFATNQQEVGDAEQTKHTLENVPNKDLKAQYWLTKLEQEITANGYFGDGLQARLKWALAISIKNALFERVSRLIFGTQISALRRLSTCDGMTDSELKGIHEEHVKRVGNLAADFVAWSGFLQSNDLVVYDNFKLKITEVGRLYLEFAKSIGVDEQKYG